MNAFTRSFISADLGAPGTLEAPHAAPLFRKSFVLEKKPRESSLLITGLGFYRLFVNGRELTRGLLSPYITDPGHVVAFDRYDLSDTLKEGENVIGVILGSGARAPIFKAHGQDTSAARGDMLLALRLECDGELLFEADESFRVHPSPIIMNDLRVGEHYDARLEEEIENWCDVGFDDTTWKKARRADMPRGEQRLCKAPPITCRAVLTPVKIWREGDAFVYDFGQNGAGLLVLHSDFERGRRISVEFGEYLRDGRLENGQITGFAKTPDYPNGSQNYIYIARGGKRDYKTSFTYQGFRYAKVHGISESEARLALFSYELMSSEMRPRGGFTSSDGELNEIQRMTRESTYSNMFHIPTDCPHREKNGWTADAALSARHMLLNVEADEVFCEWLYSVAAAVAPNGAVPGVVPVAPGVFYDSWNGPAWDTVVAELPYRLFELRDDLRGARTTEHVMMRYVAYTLTRRDERGLVAFGLGDWMPPHRPVKAPLEFTDTVMCYDTALKAAFLYDRLGRRELSRFCLGVAVEYRRAVRENLIDFETMTACGNCQTTQAMAICLGIFEEDELERAGETLVRLVEEADGHFDCGCIGMRYILRALSACGRTDLAYRAVVAPTRPSYSEMIRRGDTTLAEDFYPEEWGVNSRNHHFLGDVSAWFIDTLCGIRVAPETERVLRRAVKTGEFSHTDGASRVDIVPHLPDGVDFAEAWHETPYGEVKVTLRRSSDEMINIDITADPSLHGIVSAPEGYHFDGCRETSLRTASLYAVR